MEIRVIGTPDPKQQFRVRGEWKSIRDIKDLHARKLEYDRRTDLSAQRGFHWTRSIKELLVMAVAQGTISREEVCSMFEITSVEFDIWTETLRKRGVEGLGIRAVTGDNRMRDRLERIASLKHLYHHPDWGLSEQESEFLHVVYTHALADTSLQISYVTYHMGRCFSTPFSLRDIRVLVTRLGGIIRIQNRPQPGMAIMGSRIVMPRSVREHLQQIERERSEALGK